jgi:prepilin-type N-terminal cleavage/methylation domain-containing protein
MPYDRDGNSTDREWPHVCRHILRSTMLTVRKRDAGFTLTELMVVVVILSLLAALSTPLFRRDNNARKGRGWANIVAQGLQRARFQAMADRSSIHVLLYRDHIEMYREDPGAFVLLSSTATPEGDHDASVPSIAIWDARTDGTQPNAQNTDLTGAAGPPSASNKAIDIVFLPLGSTLGNVNWRIYIRNELLPSAHPDASFVINVRGLTGFVSANDKVVLTP